MVENIVDAVYRGVLIILEHQATYVTWLLCIMTSVAMQYSQHGILNNKYKSY